MTLDNISMNDKLFMIYNSTVETEKSTLAANQFNDISISDLHIIHMISIKKDPSISEIAKGLFVSKQAVAKQVNKLEKLDYIQKVPNKQDHRQINILLTHRGNLLCRLHNKAHNQYIESLLKDCSPTEREVLDKVLDRIINNIQIQK